MPKGLMDSFQAHQGPHNAGFATPWLMVCAVGAAARCGLPSECSSGAGCTGWGAVAVATGLCKIIDAGGEPRARVLPLLR